MCYLNKLVAIMVDQLKDNYIALIRNLRCED